MLINLKIFSCCVFLNHDSHAVLSGAEDISAQPTAGRPKAGRPEAARGAQDGKGDRRQISTGRRKQTVSNQDRHQLSRFDRQQAYARSRPRREEQRAVPLGARGKHSRRVDQRSNAQARVRDSSNKVAWSGVGLGGGRRGEPMRDPIGRARKHEAASQVYKARRIQIRDSVCPKNGSRPNCWPPGAGAT